MRLTASDFASSHRPTRCDLRVFLRHQREQEAEPGPYELVLRRLGLRHERDHLATLGTFVNLSAASFEEPAIKLDLQQNLGVILFVDSASHLRIPNHIAVAIEDEVVGNADNFDIGSADSLCGEKGRLIQDWNFLCDGVRCPLHLLLKRRSAHSGECPESRQMISLVSESKPSQDYLVSAGLCFLLSLLAQENPQVTACGTMA